MKIARENLISGLVVIALGLVFLSQAFGLEQANATEGIHPMDYPKALTWLFIAVGCCIVLVPSHRRSDSDIPLFSARTAAVSGILVAYALLLDHMGFGVTSFLAACGIGYAMGWRKLPSLLLSNLCGTAVIWSLCWYASNSRFRWAYCFRGKGRVLDGGGPSAFRTRVGKEKEKTCFSSIPCWRLFRLLPSQ